VAFVAVFMVWQALTNILFHLRYSASTWYINALANANAFRNSHMQARWCRM